MPDVSRHFSYMALALRREPAIYEKLLPIRTQKGVSLATCIKTGVDNCGHPLIKTVGMVAGDAESYEVFWALFEPVLRMISPSCQFEVPHPMDMDIRKVSD